MLSDESAAVNEDCEHPDRLTVGETYCLACGAILSQEAQ